MITKPNINISLSGVSQEISDAPQKVLFVGQMTAVGTATSGSLVENILNDNSQNTLFGINSLLAIAIRAAKRTNKITQFDAIPLDDAGAAVQATGTITFGAAATTSGTLKVVVGSHYDNSYELSVASGDTNIAVATSIAALITADTKAPVTAADALGVITLTAVNGGEEGNTIGVRVIGEVAGLTSVVVGMAAGATNPTLTNIFDVVGDNRYQTIVYQSTFDITEVKTFLDARFNISGAPLDGIAVIAKTDILANHVVYLTAQNSQSIAVACNKTVSSANWAGGILMELNFVLAAEFAAIRALRRTDKANIGSFVVSPAGSRDDFGSAALSSLPYFNTPFENLNLIDSGYDWTKIEQDQLLAAGGFVFGNNPARNSIILGEVVTTYKTDATGDPDTTFKYMNYVDTASAVREYFYNNLRNTFVQSRLTEGSIQPNRSMVNANIVGAVLDGFYAALSNDDYVLTDSGEDALKFFKQHRAVSLDMDTGTVTVTMIVPIVVQVRTLLVSMQIGFSING
jgi:phage tail sheath gpL-like